MPYSAYKDSETGNDVVAVEAGHDGILMIEKLHFEKGDFIVKFPIDLLGNQKRMVFDPKTFQTRFGRLSKVDWQALGWPV